MREQLLNISTICFVLSFTNNIFEILLTEKEIKQNRQQVNFKNNNVSNPTERSQ